MTSFESNESNIVELDGISFETVVSESVLTIPEAKRGIYTSVQLGIQITNNTQSFFYFSSSFYSLFPELIAPDDQVMQTGVSCERLNKPLESDYVLVVPGESVIFSRDAFLFWMQNPKKKRDRKLTLNIPSRYQDIYNFCPLYAGTYKLRFNYREFREAIEELSLWIEPTISQTILQNLWTGKVLTPLVDLQLVQGKF